MHKRPRRELSGGGDKKPRTSDKNSTTSSTKTKGAEEEKRRSKRKAKPEVSEGGHITSYKKRRKRKRSGGQGDQERVAQDPSWLHENEGVGETTNKKKKRKKTTSKKVGQPKRKKKANDSDAILSQPKQQDEVYRRQGRKIEDGVLVARPFSKAVKQEPTEEEGDSVPVGGGQNLSVLRKENGVEYQREPKEEKTAHDDADVERDDGGKAATQEAQAHDSVSMLGKVSTSAANTTSASLPSSSTVLTDPAQLVEALLSPSSQPMPSGAEELTIKRGSEVPAFLLSPAFGCWMPVKYYHSLLGYLRGMATCIDALE